MAKIKFGMMMTDARGKLGGQVFSKNRGGAYVRTKVTPSNPQTADQVAQRALLASASQSWRGLTEPERESWNGAVSNFSSTNVFGDIINPTGAQLHTKININIALAGGVAVTTPPLPTGISSLAGLTATAEAGTPLLELAWTSGVVPANQVLVVEATPCVSVGRYNVNNRFRVIATLPPATATGADVSTEYLAKFGSMVAGQKLFIRAKFINKLTGEVSQSLVAETVVGA